MKLLRTAAVVGVAKKLYDESRKPENQRKVLEWDTDWLSLAPGANQINMSGVSATIAWRHGWIG